MAKKVVTKQAETNKKPTVKKPKAVTVSLEQRSAELALENTRLFDETQRLLKITEDRAAELAIINPLEAAILAISSAREVEGQVKADKINLG